MHTTCPECIADIPLSDPRAGEVIVCPECGAELEVLSVEPLDLTLAPEVNEDWGE